MPVLDDVLQQKLQVLEARHERRFPQETEILEGVRVRRGGRELISFSSNDYLGLSHHPDVVAAAKNAVEKYGAGAGASRLVTGSHPLYNELETLLAEYKGTEAACVFGSGYLANVGIIPALVGKNDLILADRLSHACVLDAARISGADLMRFAHNNLEHCQMLLEANRREYQNCLIFTETVFSMDGDRAPIAALQKLARDYDAWLMTDDAHGFGIVKSHGADIQMGTLSKAAGSYGGYVCGSKTLVDYVKTSARSVIFSTALPPSVIGAAMAAMKIMQKEPALAKRALENAKYFTDLMGMQPAQSAIVPAIVKENEKALTLSKKLEENGFLVSAIRPPTVPENTARLRFAFSALHEKAQIEAVAALVKDSVCEPSH